MFWLYIISGFAALFIGLFFIFLSDSVFGGQDFSTNSRACKNLIEIIKKYNLAATGNFYDLGSCRGGIAVTVAKAFPNLSVHGVDDSKLRTVMAKLRSLFLKNAEFKKDNIFKTDVSAADIIYLYLPQELMAGLETKLQKELKPGALVISNSVTFPNWKFNFNKEQLFTYVKI